MSLSEYISLFQAAIEKELFEVISDRLPEQFDQLRQMLTYHMGWEGDGSGPEAQGKRIRPLLVLLCNQAAGGTWQDALPAAAAVELVHNFSLIHDDIQDQSEIRRGRLTVWKKWGAAQAINAGDLMFTLAFTALYRMEGKVPQHVILNAQRLLQNTCISLTQGQFLDLYYESCRSMEIEQYWPMVNGKTAALLACSCELGAAAAGVDRERQIGFGEFGRKLGLAFQVYDDCLGVWGDASATGKSTASDLVSGKKTLPILYGVQMQGEFARQWLNGPVLEADVPALADMLEREGARQFAEDTADTLTGEALMWLNKAGGTSDVVDALKELSAYLLKRQK